MRRKTRLGAACGLIFLALIIPSDANPMGRVKRGNDDLEIFLLRQKSACTVGDIVYQIGESIPGSSPCEKCTCTGKSDDGTGVSCHSVHCEVRSGCKALHRADHCCPLYQCECTRNGKTYSNGEKLEDSENPCQVCYCQGGEIVCNKIACFIRNDCEPVYLEGSCCPEYGHCPPRDPEKETKQSARDKIMTFLSDSPSKSSPKESSKLDINNLPKIQIKEVTQGKPINNEIRIKEVIPISTKAPTFTREVVVQKNEDKQTSESNTVEASNKDITPPQIIRVGDQLLFLKEGEVVPENASIITPSPVFTVIGAEGLQRVEEDPEDNSDKEIIDFGISNGKNQSDFLSSEETQGLDKMVEEALSELYATTTKEPTNDTIDKEYLGTAETYTEANDSDVTIFNTFTEEPKVSLSTDNLDDDIQAVPIEHLPEHNPEYPPIPEDIMILSMTEDTLEPLLSEIEFDRENPHSNINPKNDDKIVIVKRPVIPLSLPKHQKNSNSLKDNNLPEKILPDILPFVRGNKTNEGSNASFVPEEWLKEATEKPHVEINSPLLTLEAELPESILKTPGTNSVEEDDSKEYIFFNNGTNGNNESNNNKEAVTVDIAETTTESFEGLTDEPTVLGDYRSPGEPHLVPEWERNQTTENYDNMISSTSNPNNSILNESAVDVLNSTNDNEIDEDSDFEDNYAQNNDSSTSKPSTITNVVSTPPENDSIDDFNIDDDDDDIDGTNTSKNEVSTNLADGYTKSSLPTENILSDFDETTENIRPTKKSIVELEIFGDGQTIKPFDDKIYPQKQKKNSALIGDKNADSGKKRNILADLINLVGDVAAIGHESEVSTVLNSIDSNDKNGHKYQKPNNPSLNNDYLVPFDNIVSHTEDLKENSQIELTEYNASGDKIDLDIPMENEKVEFTTRKIIIDKQNDDDVWKLEEVDKDIELIPKVEKNPPKKDPSLEKIKEANINEKNTEVTSQPKIAEDVIIYTTVQKSHEYNTVAPNKTILKPDDFRETLISVDSNDNYGKKLTEADTTENSFTSTIMKVTGRTNNIEDSTNNVRVLGGDKLAKRETNSRTMSPKDIIDNKYLDALKSYFERRFIH